MKKIINIVLQLICVATVAAIAFIMQGMGVDGDLSNGQVGILVLCVPLCWIIFRFFGSVWFYFSAIILTLGFAGGYLNLKLDNELSVKVSEQSLSGYAIILFVVFMFCGTAMACFGEKLGLFFIRQWRMPLAAWIIVALLIDFVVELIFFDQSLGLILLQIKVSALLVGLAVGLVSKITSVIARKMTGMELKAICLIGQSGLGGFGSMHGGEEESSPASSVSSVASAVRPFGASVRPGIPSAAPMGGVGVRPPVASPAGGVGVRVPVAPKVAQPAQKVSVLDAKLEALCAVSPKPQGAPKSVPKSVGESKATSGSQGGDAEAKPAVPKSTETRKIVSSVDFG